MSNPDIKECTKKIIDTFSNISDKCVYIKENCDKSYFIDVLYAHYCFFDSNYLITGLLIFLILLISFYLLSSTANDYLSNAAQTICDNLKMSQSIAGITLLALGNGAPDVISTFVALDSPDGFEFGLGQLVGSTMFLNSFVFSMLVITSDSIKLDASSFIRDLSCLVLGFLFISITILVYKKLFLAQALIFFCIYIVYLFIVIIKEIKDKIKKPITKNNNLCIKDVEVVSSKDKKSIYNNNNNNNMQHFINCNSSNTQNNEEYKINNTDFKLQRFDTIAEDLEKTYQETSFENTSNITNIYNNRKITPDIYIEEEKNDVVNYSNNNINNFNAGNEFKANCLHTNQSNNNDNNYNSNLKVQQEDNNEKVIDFIRHSNANVFIKVAANVIANDIVKNKRSSKNLSTISNLNLHDNNNNTNNNNNNFIFEKQTKDEKIIINNNYSSSSNNNNNNNIKLKTNIKQIGETKFNNFGNKKLCLIKKRSITINPAPRSNILKNNNINKLIYDKRDSAVTYNNNKELENNVKSCLKFQLNEKDEKKVYFGEVDAYDIEEILKNRNEEKNISFNGLKSLHYRIVNNVRKSKYYSVDNNLDNDFTTKSSIVANNFNINKEKLLENTEKPLSNAALLSPVTIKNSNYNIKENTFIRIFKILKKIIYIVFLYIFDIFKKISIPAYEQENYNYYCSVLFPITSSLLISFVFELIDILTSKWWIYTSILSVLLIITIIIVITFDKKTVPNSKIILPSLAFIISIVWIYLGANLLVYIISILGILLDLPQAFLAMTFIAVGNSAADFSINMSLAKKGLGSLAIVGALSCPLFNFLFGLGISLLKLTISNIKTQMNIKLSMLNTVCIMFVSINILRLIFQGAIEKFNMKKNSGYIGIIIYVSFIVTTVIIVTYEKI